MSRKKIVLVVVGSVVALGAIAVGLAFAPGVQTWAVRKVLAGLEGPEIAVERVAAGLSSATVTGVTVRQPGLAAEVGRIEVEYSVLGYLGSGRLEVPRLVVQGLKADLRPPAPAAGGGAAPAVPAPAAPASGVRPATQPAADASPAEAFRGVLAAVVLPVDLRLGQIAVDGEVQLDATRRATFALSGGGVAAGAEARLSYRADLVDSAPDAPVRTIKAEGELTLALDADRSAERAGLQAAVTADGPGLPADPFIADVAVRRGDAGRETYTVVLAREQGGAATRLVALDAAFEPSTSALSGTWTVTLARESLAALLTGLSLPDVALDGQGAFALQTTTGAVTTSGELRGTVSRLVVLSPELEAIGGVRFATGFEAQADATRANLARLSVDVATSAGVPLVEVRSLQPVTLAFADSAVTLARPGEGLARVAIRALPVAWAQPWVAPLSLQSGEVSLALDVTATPDGSRVEARPAEPLVVRNLTVRQEERALVENLTLTVYPTLTYTAGSASARLERLEVSTPGGDALRGGLDATVTGLDQAPATSFSAAIEGRLVTLHRGHLPLDPGPLAVALDAAGAQAGSTLDLSRLKATVRRDGGGLLADVALRAPVSLDLSSGKAAGSPGLTVGVQLGEVPLAWAEPFVAGFAFAGELTGGALEIVMTSPQEVLANTLAPVTLRGVGVTQAGAALAERLDLAVDFTSALSADRLTYDVRNLTVAQGNASLLQTKVAGQVNLGAAALAVDGRGTLTADLAGLLRQPVLAPYATLNRGRLSAEFEGSYADAITAKATLALREIVARAGNQALGDVDVTLTANLKPDGSGAVEAPVKVVAAGRTTDLNLAGSFRPTEQGLTFDARVNGRQLIVDDLQAFAVLAPASEPAKPVATGPAPGRPATTPPPRAGTPPTTPAPTRDEKPFWSGAIGRMTADFGTVRYGKDTVIAPFKGVFVVTENRFALETLEGRLKEDPFKVAGAVIFEAREAKPYALAGTLNVSNLDVGALLAAANPQEKPSVETKVTAAGRLSGRGATLDDLLQHVQGTFDVKGSGGVLRALGQRGQAVGRASALIGLVGAIQGSASTLATAELASQLNELRFDSVTLKVERGADLNIKLTSLEFLSPTSRVTGTGGITYQDGVPITKQPLRLQLALAGKGALAQVLNRAGVLTGQQDEREYFTVSRAFSISGTPMSPDSGDLWRFVTEAAIRAATQRRNEEAQASGATTGAPAPSGTAAPVR